MGNVDWIVNAEGSRINHLRDKPLGISVKIKIRLT